MNQYQLQRMQEEQFRAGFNRAAGTPKQQAAIKLLKALFGLLLLCLITGAALYLFASGEAWFTRMFGG